MLENLESSPKYLWIVKLLFFFHASVFWQNCEGSTPWMKSNPTHGCITVGTTQDSW